MPREQRLFATCEVEFDRMGTRVRAITQDLSRHGVFVRTEEYLPVGDVIEIVLLLPDGQRAQLIARVAHLLPPEAAKVLGREAGMGFEILDHDGERAAPLHAYLDAMMVPSRGHEARLDAATRVVVADPSTRLLGRLSHALGEAGFEVELASNGAEAFAACIAKQPGIVLAADDMPVVDGWTLIEMLAGHPNLWDVAVVLMSDSSTDIKRLKAYRLGVRDFIEKPFTDEELAIRLRRLARPAQRPEPERVVFKGSIAQIGLATLLSLLDFERKSGILIALSARDVARIFVAAGRVVKVESSAGRDDPRGRLMALLDWRQGSFEFIACEVVGKDEVGLPTQHLLLEHARIRDEETKDG